MGRGRGNYRAGMAAALAALAITAAGCSDFGGSKTKTPAAPVDANAFPADYRAQLVAFLRQSLTTRPDFRGALISQPVLKPIGDSQHYMVCMQFGSRGQPATKVAIYLYGQMTQFVDAAQGQCSDAAYQPFTELAAALPPS
ncbi:MAG: hypothetical protein ABSE22_19680 [Xanthobacteraceae bacterium]